MSYRGRTKAYFESGFEDGRSASHDTDWQPGEMQEAAEKDTLGEIAGQILENWQQMAGTIYYDDDVTEAQLDAWEDGFYQGFVKGVEEQLEK